MTWWREPFVHFLALGGLLFAGHSLWERAVTRDAMTITVTAEELERRAVLFAAESQRTPTDADLKTLLYAMVEEEALVREARALGLDQGDTIVRRRLAQKARFVLEGTVDDVAPDGEAVCAFVDANPNQFKIPATRSFHHIYFSPETAGFEARADSALETLDASAWKSAGDPFLLNREYRDATKAELDQTFGRIFSTQLFASESSEFFGPVESAYGLHLVQVTERREATIPACEAVYADAEAKLTQGLRDDRNRRRVNDVVAKYRVSVLD